MKLKTYLSTVETAASLARKVGVSSGFVSQWCSGFRPVPIARCVAIERATGGAVTRRDLKPDDWQDIWPELARREETEGA
ncbi:MAG: helix-turn-helix domain-containing protein [Zoogloeaceae bacterium]|nr:helix-turn-helix domain-containing protein [Zoogloeaceae bacterium]